MRKGTSYFSSESVAEGHPDKICDQIADSVLDSILERDPQARVACECLATTGMVMVAGEITTETFVDIPAVARETIRRIGYTNAEYGFDYRTCAIISSIDEQSPDIAMGVDNALEVRKSEDFDIGAGDQGIMFGYACSQTPQLMPAPISYAHDVARRLAEVRRDGIVDYLRPDGKSQITVQYEDGRPVRIDTVVISTQHAPEATQAQIEADMVEKIAQAALPADMLDGQTRYLINPTGRFVTGGPQGDCGVTGRKIIVDTYGGYAPHGGGSFSGKDATKVDRSAAYAARHAAKNIVASGLADECEIQLAYAIGVAKPVSIYVDTNGTGKVSETRITELVEKHFDLRPRAIIERFGLRKPIFTQVAAYGHFGRTDIELPWESTDMADILQKEA